MNEMAQNLQQKESPDNRYFPRWEVNNDVFYCLGTDQEKHMASTNDISCSGVRMTVDNDVLPNQTMKMRIQLSKYVSVDLKGVIEWIKDVDGKKQIGVHFFNTPQKVQDLILDYAFELDSKRITQNWFKGWK